MSKAITMINSRAPMMDSTMTAVESDDDEVSPSLPVRVLVATIPVYWSFLPPEIEPIYVLLPLELPTLPDYPIFYPIPPCV